MIDIILVHTGNIFPEHINDCISQLKKYDFNIHLIISECLRSNVNSDGIILSSAEEYESTEYKSYDIKSHDVGFRDGFWKRTSSRFMIISSYIASNGMESIFHIENDVLIFSDLKDVKSLLDKSKYEMAVVLDSESRCIPSIVYFKNLDISNRLSKFIFENNSNNDMSNLFNFFKRNRNVVTNLPILPSNTLVSNDISGEIDYSNLYNKLQSIFDGAAIGQYIDGVDTRNNQNDTIGFVNETTIFNVSNFQYIFENNEPYMINGNIKTKIYNLHIHSKDLKKFTK